MEIRRHPTIILRGRRVIRHKGRLVNPVRTGRLLPVSLESLPVTIEQERPKTVRPVSREHPRLTRMALSERRASLQTQANRRQAHKMVSRALRVSRERRQALETDSPHLPAQFRGSPAIPAERRGSRIIRLGSRGIRRDKPPNQGT